MLVKKQKKITS